MNQYEIIVDKVNFIKQMAEKYNLVYEEHRQGNGEKDFGLYLDKEKGTLDGRTERKKYFILNKKIYSKRFSTDCFSDYFNDMALRSAVGLDDYPEYETERASVEELRLQNSYFINSLYRDTGSE